MKLMKNINEHIQMGPSFTILCVPNTVINMIKSFIGWIVVILFIIYGSPFRRLKIIFI